MISICFDDGYKDNVTNAVPILDTYNFKATFYVTYENLSKKNFMTINDLRLIQLKGHEVGSHSMSHPNLFFCTKRRREKEILNSKIFLENEGLEIKTFAYPFGWYNKSSINTVSGSGYIGARSFRPFHGLNTNLSNKFKLSTLVITRNTNIKNIYRWIEKSINNKNVWLIITFHSVNDSPTYWGSKPYFLEEICKKIVSLKDNTVTVKDGIIKLYD